SNAQFRQPGGTAVDPAGNVYVADQNNSTIRKISPAAVVTTIAGLPTVDGSADGTGVVTKFSFPQGVALDALTNVYVADSNNNTIRKITPTDVVSTIAGLVGISGSADGTGSAALFNSPIGVTTDSSANVYIGDTFNHTIRKITPNGNVSTLPGLAGSSGNIDGMGNAARFTLPIGVAVDGPRNDHVADAGNHIIRKTTQGR